MPVMQPPTGPIEIANPNNRPFNVINMGGMMQITFTTMRPNANDLFSGKDAPEFRGTVARRLLMPAGLAEQLVRTVADSLIKAAKSSGPTPPARARNDPLSRDREDSRAAFAALYDSSEGLVRRRNRQPEIQATWRRRRAACSSYRQARRSGSRA
jgi:hypothetical protein